MNFSLTTEYALRAVLWLAEHHDSPAGTGQIAEAVKVPPGYLSKVLQTLAKTGVVASSPGRSGGFRLNKDPELLTVMDVINAVDPFQRIERCPLKLENHRTELCPLHRSLDDALGTVQEALQATTIASLMLRAGQAAAFCHSHNGLSPDNELNLSND